MATGSSDRVGVLVLRLWIEDAGGTPFRARITASSHVMSSQEPPWTMVVASAEEACIAVRTFIERFEAGA